MDQPQKHGSASPDGEAAEGEKLEFGHYSDPELVELSDDDAEGGTTPLVIVVTVASALSAGTAAI
jgi:hypothetical protein